MTIRHSGVRQDAASTILIRLSTNVVGKIVAFSRNVINARCFVGRANSSIRADVNPAVTCAALRYANICENQKIEIKIIVTENL